MLGREVDQPGSHLFDGLGFGRVLEGSRKVDVRLPGKESSNSHGARPVHLIITMIKWIQSGSLHGRDRTREQGINRAHVHVPTDFACESHLFCRYFCSLAAIWFRGVRFGIWCIRFGVWGLGVRVGNLALGFRD